eukprot:3606209-Alexandrium_andersonii.AAC.1
MSALCAWALRSPGVPASPERLPCNSTRVRRRLGGVRVVAIACRCACAHERPRRLLRVGVRVL